MNFRVPKLGSSKVAAQLAASQECLSYTKFDSQLGIRYVMLLHNAKFRMFEFCFMLSSSNQNGTLGYNRSFYMRTRV
jgi:hypothetical protein